MSAKLSKAWPAVARSIVLDAARNYYQEMNDQFPVPDVAMEHAIAYANRELERRQGEIYEEAPSGWIKRWESGKLDAEMKKAIDAAYGSLRRAERGLRSHAIVKKKSPAQLDVEITQALSARRAKPKSSRSHATILGRGRITKKQSRALPRFTPTYYCEVTDDCGTQRPFTGYRSARSLAQSVASIFPEINAEKFATTWNATNASGSTRFAIGEE
jgi:hypothetical protein